jgi:RNA polymerase sigma-70 factor (ECF subfamily)
MAAVAAERKRFGLVRDRAEQELERMYRRHAEDVFRYSLLVLRSRPDAEDVTQATFTRAYKAIQRGERVRKPQHWLIRIAHNEYRRHLRTASRARRALREQMEGPLACGEVEVLL